MSMPGTLSASIPWIGVNAGSGAASLDHITPLSTSACRSQTPRTDCRPQCTASSDARLCADSGIVIDLDSAQCGMRTAVVSPEAQVVA